MKIRPPNAVTVAGRYAALTRLASRAHSVCAQCAKLSISNHLLAEAIFVSDLLERLTRAAADVREENFESADYVLPAFALREFGRDVHELEATLQRVVDLREKRGRSA